MFDVWSVLSLKGNVTGYFLFFRFCYPRFRQSLRANPFPFHYLHEEQVERRSPIHWAPKESHLERDRKGKRLRDLKWKNFCFRKSSVQWGYTEKEEFLAVLVCQCMREHHTAPMLHAYRPLDRLCNVLYPYCRKEIKGKMFWSFL